MCGISGIWRLNGLTVSMDEIADFNNMLRHRGPDGKGVYISKNKNMALGHRRLSIIELSDAGKQPMHDEESNLYITYNGEIYNFPELRDELKQKGHRFKTRSDTEVILAAYKQWGADCLYKFNGMWAFAIWNENDESLFAARDRFGIKPFYYSFIPSNLFAFASETIAFRKLNGFTKEIDSQNLSNCIANPFYPEMVGNTIYKGIEKLPAGNYLFLQKGKALQIKQWWHTKDHLIDVPQDAKMQVEKFKELFYDSCRIRLRSDVNMGLTLSGGLDSSSVYATVQEIYKNELADKELSPSDAPKAFIACFPGTSMDEKKYADEVIKYYQTKPSYIYPEVENLPEQIVDETQQEDFIYKTPPIAHSIYKAISKMGIKVSIDGHGADELLFGYPWMIRDLMLQSKGHHFVRHFNTYSQMRQNGSNYALNNVKEGIQIASGLIRKKSGTNSFLIENNFAKNINMEGLNNSANNIAYHSFHYNTLPTLLRNWDIASMRHGVEIRIPFLDWRLVCYLFSLPLESKLNKAFSKKILRDAMVGKLPENIRQRRFKIGINAPMVEWFNGPLNSWIEDIIASRKFIEASIWHGKKLANTIQEINSKRIWDQRSCDTFWPYLNASILMQ